MDDVIKFGLVVAILLAVGTFVMFMVPIAMRNYRKASLIGREPNGDVDALRAEVDELRSLAPRMAELEERVDFAERLLQSRVPTGRLGDGTG